VAYEDGVELNAELIQTKEQGHGDTPQERKESSPEFGNTATKEVEDLSIFKTLSDNVKGMASSNPLPPSPPFTFLINNLNLEGNEWLEALINMSLSTRPTQIVTRPLDTYVIGFSLAMLTIKIVTMTFTCKVLLKNYYLTMPII
jgi:hypothetical protein